MTAFNSIRIHGRKLPNLLLLNTLCCVDSGAPAAQARPHTYIVQQRKPFHTFYLSFGKNYLSPNIPKNHQKGFTKKSRNVDMWEDLRDF